MNADAAADRGALPGWTPAYERRAVLLLTIDYGLVGLDRWIVAPLAPNIMADLKLSAQDLNNLTAESGVCWSATSVLLGALSDRIGRKKVLIPSLLVFSIMSNLSGAVAGFTRCSSCGG